MQNKKLFILLRCGLILVGVLPILIVLFRSYELTRPVGESLDAVFIPLCHRIPERTLYFHNTPMPICSRCTGVYVSLCIAAIIQKPIFSMKTWKVLWGIAAFFMLTDICLQDLGVHGVWHSTRLLTGFFGGYVVAVPFLQQIRQSYSM